MEGKLHTYHPKRRLTLFEFKPHFASSTRQHGKPSKNILLFIGGMYDNFLSTPYVPELACLFPNDTSTPPSWTVMHAQLSSAMTAWGVSSLDKDVEQIATAVMYVRDYVVRDYSSAIKPEDVTIVLMGHSTGCQDVLHYLYTSPSVGKAARPVIQGAILQAPASDREGVLNTISQGFAASTAYEDLLEHIKSVPQEDWDDTLLSMKQTKPLFGPTPINVTRFLSLTSPDSPKKPGQDDLFSSDLTDERLRSTFGKVGGSEAFRVSRSSNTLDQHTKPSMLIMISGADEYVPEHIDKTRLIERWGAAIEHDGKAVLDPDSGVIEGGKHDLSGDTEVEKTARDNMKERLLRYLRRVTGEAASVGQELSMDDIGKALAGIEEAQKRNEGKL